MKSPDPARTMSARWWGWCPGCGRMEGPCRVGAVSWAYCTRHYTKWTVTDRGDVVPGACPDRFGAYRKVSGFGPVEPEDWEGDRWDGLTDAERRTFTEQARARVAGRAP